MDAVNTNLYRTLLNQLHDAAYIVDTQGKIIDMNRAAQELFGYSRAEVEVQHVKTYFTEREQFRTLLETLAEKGEVKDYTIHVRHKNGADVGCLLNATIQYDDYGNVIAYLGVVHDIAADAKAEANLHQAHQNLQAKADSLAIINRISDTLYKFRDFDTVLDQSVQVIQAYSQADAVALFSLDKAANALWMLRSAGFDEEVLEVGSRLPLEGSLSGLTIARKAIITSQDLSQDDRLEANVRRALAEQGLRNVISIPLLFQEDVWGVLNLIFRSEAKVAGQKRETLLSIGKTIALAVANAEFIQQVRNEVQIREQAEAALTERIRYEAGLSSASQALLDDNQNAVQDAIERLLLATDACRVYLFENFEDPVDGLCMRQTHEACAPGIQPEIDNSIFQHLPYQDGFGRWRETLATGNEVCGRVTDFPQAEQEILASQNILSMLVLPITVHGSWYGFIGFDDTQTAREWHIDDVQLLQTAASMIGSYIERKEAQQERQILSTAVEQSANLILITDKDGNIEYVNPAFEQLTGFTKEEAIGQTPRILKSGKHDQAYYEALWKKILSGETHHGVTVNKKKNGELYYEDKIISPIINSHGEVTHFLSTATDVTRRQELEDRLREREMFLQSIINNIPQSIFWKDRNFVYLGCNQNFARAAGFDDPQAIVGKTDYDMPWKEEEADFFREVDRRVMRTGSAELGIIEPQLQADGSQQWLETNKIPLRNANGEIIGILGTFREITERIEMQKQIEKSLERRSREVQLTTRIAQQIATAPSLEDLYQRVVDQVKEQFGYYHVQLLRYDPALDTVALVVGYGETGEKMLAMNHSMPMGIGVIGTAAALKRSILRPDVTTDSNWLPNPLLPDTKGELAVPIKMGERVLGVLDVQSDQADALSEEDQLLLEGLCGQIATAIESTNLRQEMESRLYELNALQRQLSREGWAHYQQKRTRADGYRFDQKGLKSLKSLPAAANGTVAENGRFTPTTDTQPEVVAQPLRVRGQTIGSVGIQLDPEQPLSAEEEAFLTAVSEEVAQALESARLFEETQTALAEQEKLTSELETVAQVSTAASTILEVDHLLQSVVDLAKTSFQLYHAHIYLMDEENNVLTLKAGAGDVGRLMVLEGRDIYPHTESLVARAARTKEGVLENDVRKTVDFLPHPLLPETKAELAVPMIVGDKLVGILDLQSDRVNAFADEGLKIYRTLAAQIAVAVENAKQYVAQVKTAEKLREVDQIKSEFLASMSHELRTPLNSIIGFADVLLEGLDGDLNERMEEDVRLIRDSGRHLRELIGDILDMSKIEAGRMDLNYEEVDMRRMAHDLMATAQPLAQEKSLQLFMELDEEVGSMTADRTRVRQVLWNIMGNAIKFTDEGHVTLTMKSKDDHLLVAISDTGIGIKQENIPIVFEQFRQVEGGLSRPSGGTGLGMPITKKLIELHGGTIWVESKIGVGSTFYFTLPYEPPVAENPTA